MALKALHTQHILRCPKSVNSSKINPEGFKDFIPPNVVVEEVRGLTLEQSRKPCRWEITAKLRGG
jgi:hypothetical protein